MSDISHRYILTLSCSDARGIVAAVTGFLAENLGFIIESAQFGDASTAKFFMRVEFSLENGAEEEGAFRQKFAGQVAQRFGMQWRLINKQHKSRVLIMVSKHGHCLNDLLYRHQTGQLAIDIPAIVSNHTDWQRTAEWHGIPFFHLTSPSPAQRGRAGEGAVQQGASSALVGSLPNPLPRAGKGEENNDAQLLNLINRHDIDIVVLARYMQILSAELCEALAGRAINIHHSFLPSFKGAKPYQQAFDRGVKLIGATAHFVTTDLDEGPIIEQEVARVDHTHTPETLTNIGRDIECQVLARALKFHTEHRVLLNGSKTVVFR